MGCGYKIITAGTLRLILTGVILVSGLVMNCGANKGDETEVDLLEYFRKRIEEFREDGKFRGKIDSDVIAEELNEENIRPAATAIKYDTDHVAMQAAKMLVQFGFQLDPLYDSGIKILRDELIIRTLLEKGLNETGPLADYILETIQKHTPPEHIAKFGPLFIDRLESTPDQTLLLIIAKGKVLKARKILEREENQSRMSGWEEYKIALAALGDEELEAPYIDRFMKTDDPETKAGLAAKLGLIGTRNALAALAEEVRTGLVIEMTNVMRKSVRLDIIAAMSYNYPDREFLYDNAITSDEGYQRVEEFCREKFGVTWEKERPDFLTIQGFPSEPAPE
ncbi:MAG: hypothetical protein R6U43_02650 [Candidatus Krumholzibacteriales bacterium]